MNSYWVKTNSIIKKIFSNYIWDIPNNENKIYLTFDDGPTPIVTEWVLKELKKYNAKATFFCLGKNVKANSDIFLKIINEGHSIGNHTFNHLNGWKTMTDKYIENVKLTEAVFEKQLYDNPSFIISKLFRPPYGKIKNSQSKKLRQLGYEIILWDVLSADFDQNTSPERCVKNVLSNVKSGSIIVFHDSVKAFSNLENSLPKTLENLKKRGFAFDTIS